MLDRVPAFAWLSPVRFSRRIASRLIIPRVNRPIARATLRDPPRKLDCRSRIKLPAWWIDILQRSLPENCPLPSRGPAIGTLEPQFLDGLVASSFFNPPPLLFTGTPCKLEARQYFSPDVFVTIFLFTPAEERGSDCEQRWSWVNYVSTISTNRIARNHGKCCPLFSIRKWNIEK